MMKPNVCVDFDGVLDTYTGWQGEDELFEPTTDAGLFLDLLFSEYNVIIFSTRNSDKIWEWLKKYHLDRYVSDVTNIKVGAVAYIDDRAIMFYGNYGDVIKELDGFKTHWERKK